MLIIICFDFDSILHGNNNSFANRSQPPTFSLTLNLACTISLPTGATPTAVPVQKTSSASINSSTLTTRSSTWTKYWSIISEFEKENEKKNTQISKLVKSMCFYFLLFVFRISGQKKLPYDQFSTFLFFFYFLFN